MTTRAPILICSLAGALVVLSLAALAQPVQAQTATPTPTPTATPVVVTVVDETTLTTSPWYDLMVARIDDFFGGIWEWFDQAESSIAGLQDAADTMAALLVEGSMEIGDESLTIEDMTADAVDAVAGVFMTVDAPTQAWLLKYALSALGLASAALWLLRRQRPGTSAWGPHEKQG